MQAQTIKTTLSFSPGFLQQIRTIAKEQGWSMSRVIEEYLTDHLKAKEQQRLTKMYTALRKWQGSGSSETTDASLTIDETMYGQRDIQRGNHEE